MDCAQETYARLSHAETNELRQKLDGALLQLKAIHKGKLDPDVDDGQAIKEFGEVVIEICQIEIKTSDQLEILYDALRYYEEEGILNGDYESDHGGELHIHALKALGRHALAERRAAKSDHTDLKAWLDS